MTPKLYCNDLGFHRSFRISNNHSLNSGAILQIECGSLSALERPGDTYQLQLLLHDTGGSDFDPNSWWSRSLVTATLTSSLICSVGASLRAFSAPAWDLEVFCLCYLISPSKWTSYHWFWFSESNLQYLKPGSIEVCECIADEYT